MKILIVTQYFWPENFRINDLAEDLSKRGHDVTVLTGKPNYPSGRFFPGYGFLKGGKERLNNVDIIRVPLIPRGDASSLRLALNYLSFVCFASLLAPFRCSKDYDVIFTYGPSPITVAIPAIVMRYIKKTPMMFWVQDLWPESLSATGAITSQRVLSGVKWMVRAIYTHCDYVLVQSRAFIEPAIKSGADSETIHYFPNWAEDIYQSPRLISDRLDKIELPNGFIVMFAGNLGAAQSLETIIEAADRLRDCDIYWVILGDGRRAEWMREQIQERGLNQRVHMLGRKPMESMPHYFAQADALLVTLRSDPIFAATIPGKVQSYLASGRPVIAALDGEGAKIVQESGAGFAVPAGDATKLAEAVACMSKFSKDELRDMGEAATDYYNNNFAKKHLVDQLERWMSESRKVDKCVS